MSDEPDPVWSELAPGLRERHEFLTNIARQVRIQFMAGKTESEVLEWLEDQGFSFSTAVEFLARYPRGDLREWQYELVSFDMAEARERRRERMERRERSRKLAEGPDQAFAIPDDSYAQVLVREAARKSWTPLIVICLLVIASLVLSAYVLQ